MINMTSSIYRRASVRDPQEVTVKRNFGGLGARPLTLILLIALFIRLIGIDHGFPYIYHPDEPAVIRTALGIRFDPNPHHFDWPHLYIYLNYFVYMVFAKLRDIITAIGLNSQLSRVAPLIYNDNLFFYLLSRIFSATLGALTVIPIYLWVKKLASNKSALLASALLALAPLHVRNSHYALIDVPMLFFLSWSLYFASEASERRRPAEGRGFHFITFSPILAGLFLGFSASTKYNGVLGGLFIVALLLLQKTKALKQRVFDIFKLGLFTILGFIVGTPFSVLDFKTFTRTDGPQGALWQFTNVGKVDFWVQISQFIDALITKLPENLGYGAYIIFVLGSLIILYNLFKDRRANLNANLNKGVVLSLAVFFILTFYVSGLEKNRSHYYLIVYPFFLAVSGWALTYLVEKIKQPVLKITLLLVVLLPSLIMSVQNIVDLQTKTSSTIYGGDVAIKIDEK